MMTFLFHLFLLMRFEWLMVSRLLLLKSSAGNRGDHDKKDEYTYFFHNWVTT
ncbi:MAG TPA: hypothetical protein VNB90_02475 [Cytophagaceae bacterium]|nr:hypothetical protein [Cytophagaceae bacterium]